MRRIQTVCALLIGLTFAAFWPVLYNEFTTLDDLTYVTNNPHVVTGLSWPNVHWSFQMGYAGNWHPLTWFSHMLDVEMFGLRPAGHHLVSLLLHLASSLLLFFVLNRMTGRTWRSGFVAGLFAVHPLHVESVAWIAERKDTLSAFFFMLTLWAYARYVQAKGPEAKRSDPAKQKKTRNEKRQSPSANGGNLAPVCFYVLGVICFALGLLSKAMLVTLPFLLLLLDYWPLRRFDFGNKNSRAIASLLIEKLPLFLLAAGSCVITFLAQQRGGAVAALTTVPLGFRLQNALISCVVYLEKTVWPSALAPYYPLPAAIGFEHVLFGAIVLVTVTVIALATLQTRSYLGVGWFWYLGMLIPVIGLVQVGGQSHADRYTYLPLIGIFLAATWLVSDRLALGQGQAVPKHEAFSSFKSARGIAVAVAALTLLAVCGGLTRRQSLVWHDSETLYRHTLAVTADNAFVQINLGNELLKQKKYDEAAQCFAEAARIDPRRPEAQGSWAFVLAAQGKPAEAVARYRSAIELEPDRALTHFLLGNALRSLHKSDEAIAEYETALRLDPALWQAHTELGTALGQAGKMEQALREFKFALAEELVPRAGATNQDLSGADRAASAIQPDRATAESAMMPLALRPKVDLARAHHQYALVLARAGNLSAALDHLREAARLNPDPQIYQDLALALTGAGRPDEAAAQYREALRLTPNSPVALNNLAWMLAASSKSEVRSGAEAVRLAEQACTLTGFKEPVFVGTLAAAYAEASQFPEAIKTAEKAIALASESGQKQVLERNQQLLHLYRSGKPFHEPSRP